MIAVLLHKPNVWCELHGWSPKFFTEELKREIDIFCELFVQPAVEAGLKKFVESTDPQPYLP